MKIRTILAAALTLGCLFTASADEISGPGRQTLNSESWGSIYYVPIELKDYEYRRGSETGKRSMTSHFGKVDISDNGLGQYELTYPKGKVVVEGSPNLTKVSFFGQNYQFSRAANVFTVKTPSEEIVYKFESHAITVSGKKGVLKVVEKEGVYTAAGPSGHYSYTPTDNGGFTVKGGPLGNFPYFYRGVLLHSAGVGVFIDFKKLDGENPMFKLIDWAPILEVKI